MRVFVVAVLVAAWIGSACAQSVELLDPAEEYRLAFEAEKKGDLKAALQHWENLNDSCDMNTAMRFHVVDRIRKLRPKVPVDPKKQPANTWTCLVLIYKNLKFEWTDNTGKKQHIVTTMSEQDIKAVRHGMDNFAKHVLNYTSRELRISYEVKLVEHTLSALVGEDEFWCSPQQMAKDMDGVEHGAYDTVFAYTKFQQKKDGLAIPAAFAGGSLGADAGPKGCGSINIILWVSNLTPEARDGEIELHEWLHQVDWAFTAIQGYPDDICPNPDHGRMEGDFGGDPDFRRTPEMKNWMPYYEHMMRDHVTRRMWRNVSMHRVPQTPWSNRAINEWLVLGPFEKTGGKTFRTAFIEEETIEPRPKLRTKGKQWHVVRSKGLVLDLDRSFIPNENVVAYAHVYVHSDKAQRAQLRIGSDDGAVVWHNGRLIYRVEVPRVLRLDENVVDVMLAEGWNRFLFKVDEIGGGWRLSARLTDPAGKAFTNVRHAVSPSDRPGE